MSIPFNPDPADTFMSWAGNDNTAAAGNLTFEAVPAKPWDDDDVESESSPSLVVASVADRQSRFSTAACAPRT
jgi:hypothetical protein